MDLQIAVAASMLPLGRERAAVLYKEHRLGPGNAPLERMLAASRAAPGGHPALVGEALRRAAEAVDAAQPLGIDAIPWFDPRYPVLLDCAPSPPPVLWVKGRPEALAMATVAIVGSRAATDYAREVAERLAAELAGRGIAIASGLARGVDSAAHRGSLTAGGITTAVLGCGPDRVYPAEHRSLAAAISKTGVLVSELAPGAAPAPEHFPLRNRIISGISLAVVVVEASEKSGSLITARYALDQGRDVMAVPGNVLSGRNRGSHALLKDGAKVVESADDILGELGWPVRQPAAYSISKLLISDPLLARMEPGEVYRLDDLIAATGIEGPRLLGRLTQFELDGRVRSTPGGGFVRCPQ
jgi:DNA processing protein